MSNKLKTFLFALLSPIIIMGQTPNKPSSCGTNAPPPEWETWFGNAVKEYVKNLESGKTQMVTHEIPVIFHIIHFGEAVGVYPNIDTNEVKSQIAVLNADFAGTGLNVGNVPAAFANLVANTGIKFCLASKNPQGGVLPEKGINRVDAAFNTWVNPNTPTVNIRNYIELYAKPTTMWDPIRYLNVWLSDKPSTEPMNGYATYPGGTSLNGVPSGEIGTINNDGIWVWTKAFGTFGVQLPPLDEGRTLTHEIGHWLGLRHTWGDGNCYTDYCNDTPWAKMENTGCPPVPSFIDRCGAGQSSFGEMTMNFMDGTDDACKYMFTHDQNIRIQTALSQCNFRNALGTHNNCESTSTTAPSPAFASFNLVSIPCIGTPFTAFNTSSGNPPPTYIWSSSPPAVFNPAPSVANPAISISTPGSYTISLIATNSITSSTFTYVINSISNCPFISTCMDTLSLVKPVDTLNLYKAPNSALTIGCQTGFAGFLTGTNCYKDKEFAQFFPPSSYTSVPSPQVNSAIVLFDPIGTSNGSGNNIPISCRVYGGNVTLGPGAQIGSSTASLSAIDSSPISNAISYVGNPNLVYPSGLIAYRFDFNSPVIINNNTGFYIGIDAPYYSTSDSIRIYSSQKVPVSLDSNAWFLEFNNNWRTFRTFRNAKIQLGIIPIITCSPLVGIEEDKNSFAANLNLMPNPGNGLFNLVFSLSKAQDISMKITNTMGQEITNGKWNGISTGVYQIDLSHQADGIYFVELSSGQNKVVKKLVLAH